MPECPFVVIAGGTKPVIRKSCINLKVGAVSEANECDPGGCVTLNDDDDDGSGVPDREQTGAVPGEDDLLAVTVQQSGLALPGGESVVFDVHVGFGSRIRVYESADRTGEVPSVPLLVPAADLPKAFYVEGIGPSLNPRDVVVEASYNGSLGTAADKARISVLGVGMAYVPTGFASIDVQYKTFIATEVVETFPIPEFVYPFYAGDNRWFSAAAGPTDGRSYQACTVTTNPGSVSGILIGLPVKGFGESIGYDNEDGSDVTPCTRYCAHGYGDWCFLPTETPECVLTLAVTSDNLRVDATRIDSQEFMLHILVAGGNPCAPPSPTIDVDLSLIFRQQCAGGVLGNAEFRGYGVHDGFPWHELYINGALKYSHDPCATGEDPWSLFPPAEHHFEQDLPGFDEWQGAP